MRLACRVLAAFGLLCLFGAPAARATGCGAMAALVLPDTRVLSATEVAAGDLAPAPGAKPATVAVPAFCRVAAEAAPTPDSRIGFELWLPLPAAWNGKLLGIGNGGYSSVLDYAAMADGLRRGYAAVATDQGHQGEDLRFVIGHPGKIEDWADRAVHAMTVAAKLMVRDRMGRWPARAYFDGCSTGGFQALAEAQRHPADYDGIVAGAPGYPRINLSASFLAAWIANHDAAGAEILPRGKLALLNAAAVASCDAQDGVRDGVIDDPRRCRFDPGALLCRAGDAADCLTAPQVEAVRRIYAGPHDPRTGAPVFPGWDPGSEAPGGDPALGWTAYIVGQPEPVRLELWKFWLFGDPGFDWHSFDFHRDLAEANAALPSMNATSPDLSAFRARGGKLLMYHGWADNVSSARTSIDYWRSAAEAAGSQAAAQEFFRLFLVPGMAHCGNGPGAGTFDALGVLDAWADRGEAPARIVAFHQTAGRVDRTRPLCAFPQRARFNGTGNPDDAASFSCADEADAPAPGDGAWLRALQHPDAAR